MWAPSRPGAKDVASPDRPNELPRYDEFVATEAKKREAEQVSYADLLAARREAIRRAERMTKDDAFRPLLTTIESTETRTRLQTERPERGCAPLGNAPAKCPAATNASRVEFRRAVETIDNRGSLIDLLL